MKIEFDPAKSEKNARQRGLPFHLVKQFDWETAVFWEDARFPYGETRIVALGFIRERLHIVCFTPVIGAARVISFRKANTREVRRYEKEKTSD
ncbi:MAG TPA: BrnT family toxin [Micropepsaceae bacterium]|nr:BrnT family toxin [Micropepsaceae bacterium]